MLGLLIGAIRRSVREPVFRSLAERQLAAARLEALPRHLARRRLHILPGGRRQLAGLGKEGLRLRFWRDWAFIVVPVLASCAPLPKVEYWGGFFRHLHPPRYTFQVPDGWRQATISDYPSLGFNRRLFQTLDEAGRSAAMQRAELEMRGSDTGLISSRGAWIQVMSRVGPGGWYTFKDLRFGLSDGEKQAIWQQLSTNLIQTAPAAEKPNLTLESIDVLEDYSVRSVLRLRFTADVPRGSMHWTVLEFYDSSGVVTVAHVGTPEDRDEGIAGLEVIARWFRFD